MLSSLLLFLYSIYRIKFPKENANRIRIKFKIKESAKSVKWWKQHSFIHSSGDDSVSSRSLLPVIDTQPIDWRIKVCVPPGFTAWVPTRICIRKPPITCTGCNRALCSFGTRATPPELLGFVIAKHLMQINLLDSPVPVRIWCQSTVYVNAQNLASVFRVLLKGSDMLLPGYGFSCYSIVVVPSSWNILGLALRSGVFMSASVIERCSLHNGSAYQLCAHEMSHQWFGLGVSSLEPWMNEAFACYCEVRIPQLGLEYNNNDAFTQLLLIGFMRERLLSDHIRNSQPEYCSIISSNDTACRNKGYLILLHLMLKLGTPIIFDKLLRGWCSENVGKRVSSNDFLLYYNKFVYDNRIGIESEVRESDMREWLESSEFPDVLRPPRTQPSIIKILNQIETASSLRDKTIFAKWSELPYERELWCLTMDSVRNNSNVKINNAVLLSLAADPKLMPRNDLEIEGRFLDIVINLQLEDLYPAVENFIVKHQSMGIFLLGELLFGGVTERKLALDIRKKLSGCQMNDAFQMTENLFLEHNVTELNYMREPSEIISSDDNESESPKKRIYGNSNGHIKRSKRDDQRNSAA